MASDISIYLITQTSSTILLTRKLLLQQIQKGRSSKGIMVCSNRSRRRNLFRRLGLSIIVKFEWGIIRLDFGLGAPGI